MTKHIVDKKLNRLCRQYSPFQRKYDLIFPFASGYGKNLTGTSGCPVVRIRHFHC